MKNIVSIRIGYQIRVGLSLVEAEIPGAVGIIQIKDIDQAGIFKQEVLQNGGMAPYIWPKTISYILPETDVSRYCVHKGDVLFLSRGQKAFAIPITEPLENTVATYYFYILRPETSQILPEYLALSLNLPLAQSYIRNNLGGTGMPFITKSAVEDLPISIPSLDIQKATVALEKLRQQEELILRKLVDARHRQFTAVYKESIQQGT